ncbi:MAG: hypothetical protein NTY98_05025, partial [Verrucomicrobia bacterium]|nr:hypothetical protein [Verrucomicrobiota bacterium]
DGNSATFPASMVPWPGNWGRWLRCEAATVRGAALQASCVQADIFVSFAHYGSKSVSYTAVGAQPTHLFTSHMLGL